MTTDSPILPRFIHAPWATERRVPLYPPPSVSANPGLPVRPQTVVAIYKPVSGPSGLWKFWGEWKFEYQGVVVLP